MTGVWEIVNIQECRKAGLSKTATAQRLNLDRGTVAKYWDVEEPLKAPPVYQAKFQNRSLQRVYHKSTGKMA